MRAFPKTLLGAAALVMLASQSLHGAEFVNRAFTSNHQTVFASAFHRSAKLKNSDGEVRTRYTPSAAAVGYHSNHGPFKWGFAFSYEEGTRKYSGDGYDYRVKSGIPGVSLFAGFNTPFGIYVESSTYLGYGTFKGRNFSSAGTGRLGDTGKEHKYLFASYLEAGLTLELPLGTIVSPHVGLEYARSPGETYSWGDGGPRLNYRSQDTLEASAGITFASTIRMGVIRITPSVDFTVFDSVGKKDSLNYHPGFAYQTARGWRVAGVSGDHVGGRARAGVDISFGERAHLGVDYTYERRKGYTDNRVSALLGWSF